MKYQLVLQWPASSIKDYDEMMWVEEALVNGICDDIAVIDGHDAGSGQVNIFLLTDDPVRAFERVKQVMGSKDFMVGLKAAFRECTGHEYRIIWPTDATSFSVS